MRYRAVFVILLVTMCIGQEPQQEVAEEVESPAYEELPEEEPPPPDELIQGLIQAYFDALNQRSTDQVTALTHPYYASDVSVLMDFVTQNNISFTVTSFSSLMDEEEFREMMKSLSDAEFAQQVGKRGFSYEVVLTVTKGDAVYEEFVIFMEVGETEEGWKVLDPYTLQAIIEAELEVKESEK